MAPRYLGSMFGTALRTPFARAAAAVIAGRLRAPAPPIDAQVDTVPAPARIDVPAPAVAAATLTPADPIAAAAPQVVAFRTPLAHADPDGSRVLPLRPDSSWPDRRAHERISNPFRGFPFRAAHLARILND